MTSAPWAIHVRGLRMAFGSRVVLDGIDFDVAPGTIFALLGPNGAGKTTTVDILTTLLRPDAGMVRIAGRDVLREPEAVRAAIGVTGQASGVDILLTGEENLMLMAALRHLDRSAAKRRIGDLLERFDLTAAAGRRAATYSGGMRRRLDLAMTLVGDPKVLFLDEPTAALDLTSRRAIWRMIEDAVAGGVTVFLTTQYLEEADHLAHRVAMLDGGRLIAEGPPDALKSRLPGGHARLHFRNPSALASVAATLTGAVRDDEALVLRVPTDGTPRALMELLGRLGPDGGAVERVSVHTPTLDDVFLALTGADERKGASPA